MSDPLDYSDRYNTQLSPEEEAAFTIWAQKMGRMGDWRDYDLRGAFLSNAEESANGHLPDTWKKPNHPTFSTGSKYNGIDGAQGGKWVQDPATTRWAFRASPYVMNLHGPAMLRQYFQKVEPKSALVLP